MEQLAYGMAGRQVGVYDMLASATEPATRVGTTDMVAPTASTLSRKAVLGTSPRMQLEVNVPQRVVQAQGTHYRKDNVQFGGEGLEVVGRDEPGYRSVIGRNGHLRSGILPADAPQLIAAWEHEYPCCSLHRKSDIGEQLMRRCVVKAYVSPNNGIKIW
jgi:hypothetical protein